MEYRHAAETLQQVGFACVLLHNFMIMQRTPLTPLETGFLAGVVRAAMMRFRIHCRVVRHHVSVSRFNFPAIAGKGGLVGKERRRLLLVELGYLQADAPLPKVPKAPSKNLKRRRDDNSEVELADDE